MSNTLDFGEIDQLAITILVDNKADLIVKSSETIKYFTDQPLLAEHGFSALLDLGEVGQRILWDAGVSRVALTENMRRMKIDPASIDQIVLSHGHYDHTNGLPEIRVLAPEARLIVHAAALVPKYSVGSLGPARAIGISPAARAAIEQLPADRITRSAQPVSIAPNIGVTLKEANNGNQQFSTRKPHPGIPALMPDRR